MADFVTKFTSLEGLTIAERRKNFFTLLHQNSSLKNNTEALNHIVENLKPRNYLEALFRLDFLIYFRRTEELRNMLKEGNDVFVSKIARQVWFFKEAFADVDAEELVNEILPTMSFSVRMKVLRKLSRYLPDEKFDHVFDAVTTRYGIFRAKHFITGCSPDKVRQLLRDHNIKLTSTQLIILHDKDSELIKYYFEQTDDFIHHGKYKKLLRFLFKENRHLFDQFQTKHSFAYRYGRRSTKQFVVSKKNEIIQNASKFDYLHMRTVLRKLGKDSVTLFKNVLPAEFKYFNLRDWSIKIFPHKYHYNLCFNIVPVHYNIKFANYPEFITVELLNLTPDQTEKVALVKVKIDSGCDDFIKYLPTNESVPLIKEKINLRSDIYERSRLIRDLIETCHINDDIDALYAVMKYFCFRHKNDDLSVHLEFIRNIENRFGFGQFTEQMWELLNELLLIHVLKYEQNSKIFEKIQTRPLLSFNIGISNRQQLAYLEFLFKKSAPIDEYIDDYFEHHSWPAWGEYDKGFCKYFLLYAINKFPREIEKQEDMHYNSTFIDAINKFSNTYDDEKLSFHDFPLLVDTFNYAIKNTQVRYGYIYETFVSKIFTSEKNQYRDDYLKIYFDNFTFYYQVNHVKWFLRYDPLIVIENFDTIFDVILENDNAQLWYLLRKFRHLKLDEKLIQSCTSKLKDDANFKIKAKLVTCLAVLMTPEDYSNLADSYKPENKKLDIKNVKVVRLYNTQLAIAEEFKRVKSYKVLPSLLNYCVGDYFNKALGSLYSVMYRTPENLLDQYLDWLSNKAVSVRKHALFLACELSTPTRVENMIRLLNKQEGVQSLQKHMFSATIKYFLKNPSDTCFELIKANMVYISKEDEESLESITSNVYNIPMKYRPQYINYSWNFLEQIMDAWAKLKPLKESLLSSMNEEVIAELPLDFLLNIIQQHYMTEKRVKDLRYIISFMYRVVEVKEDKARILEIIFNILDQCQNQADIFNFLTKWHSSIMESKNYNKKYLIPYVDYYEKKISGIRDFTHFVKIFFLRLKVESSRKPSVEELAQHVIAFFKDLLSSHGPYITQLFAPKMRSNLDYFTSHSYEFYEICYIMIRDNLDPHVAMLLLNILPVRPSCPSDRAKLNQIFDQIKRLNDRCIELHLSLKLIDH